MVRISAGALTPDTVPEAKDYLWKCFSNQGMQFSRAGAGLAPPCSFFLSVWQPGCQPPGADGAAWNSSGRLLSSYQSGLGRGRGCRGLLWEKLESHTWGGAGGGGGCRAGGLSCHIPPARRELSWAPCPYLGRRCLLTRALWDAIAGWLTGVGGGGGGGGGEPRRGGGKWGKQNTPRPRSPVDPGGKTNPGEEESLSNSSSYHLWGFTMRMLG